MSYSREETSSDKTDGKEAFDRINKDYNAARRKMRKVDQGTEQYIEAKEALNASRRELTKWKKKYDRSNYKKELKKKNRQQQERRKDPTVLKKHHLSTNICRLNRKMETGHGTESDRLRLKKDKEDYAELRSKKTNRQTPKINEQEKAEIQCTEIHSVSPRKKRKVTHQVTHQVVNEEKLSDNNSVSEFESESRSVDFKHEIANEEALPVLSNKVNKTQNLMEKELKSLNKNTLDGPWWTNAELSTKRRKPSKQQEEHFVTSLKSQSRFKSTESDTVDSDSDSAAQRSAAKILSNLKLFKPKNRQGAGNRQATETSKNFNNKSSK